MFINALVLFLLSISFHTVWNDCRYDCLQGAIMFKPSMSVNNNNPVWFSAGESKHHRRGSRPGLYRSEHWPVWIRSACCHLFNAAWCEVYNPHPHPRHSCSEYAAHLFTLEERSRRKHFTCNYIIGTFLDHIFIGRPVKCSGQNLFFCQTVSKCLILRRFFLQC